MAGSASRFLSLLASLILVCPQAQAAGFIMVDPIVGLPNRVAHITRPPRRVLPPVGIVPSPPAPPVLKGKVHFGVHLKSEEIKVDIKDQVAKTYVIQEFANNTDRNLAGTYLFPLPDDTTFSSFSLHIDGKPVEGKILEAAEARAQYEAIVRRMVDPGLLEYADYKTVRARIFPIPAHGTKKVELEYTQVLKAENGMLKYRFPLRSKGQDTPSDSVNVNVKLASARGIRTIWSPTHIVRSSKSSDHKAKVSYTASHIIPDKDFLLCYSVSAQDLSANLITHRQQASDGYFLLTLTPPLKARAVSAKDIVLAVDTSGSMRGKKLEQNKKALEYVVNALNPQDRFNIVEFNTDVEQMTEGLLPATAANKAQAKVFINELEARGGTNIGDALKTGVSMLGSRSARPAYLILMTDGEPTVGLKDLNQLNATIPKESRIRLFDFGVGYDINTRLINKLAAQHHGTSHYVEPDENIEIALSSFYRKIKNPVLTDVKLTYQGIQVKDVYPREVTDVFAGTQALLIGKYKGSGPASVKLSGKLNGVEKTYEFPLKFAAQATGNSYLPRIWAMRRIGHLTEVAQQNGDAREVVDEIVALSKRHGIISAYTSFLATDPKENQRINRPRPMPVPRARVMPMAGGARAMPQSSASIRHAQDDLSLAGRVRSFFGQMPNAQFTGAGARPMEEAAATRRYKNKGAFARGAEFEGNTLAYRLSNAPASGKKAVRQSKLMRDLSRSDKIYLSKDESVSFKTIKDKTFRLEKGFWTDTAFNAKQLARAETVRFGSKRYFELIRSRPQLAKYLSVGRKVIVVFQGRIYKIVDKA